MPRILFIGFIFFTHVLSAEVVELLPFKDNTIFEPETIDPNNPSFTFSNGAGDYFFAGRTDIGARFKIRRGLIEFDVAGAIPQGATILRADLRLYLSNTKREGGVKTTDVALHRALQEWGEGASDASQGEGVGASAQPGDATWFHTSFPDTLWNNEGGDFDPTPSSVEPIGDKFQFYTWEGPGLANDVQVWLDNPSSNHGWMLIGDEVDVVTAKRFDSRTSFNFASDLVTPTKPVLIIEYTTGQAIPPNRLVNISSRGFTGPGNNIMIAGFVVEGAAPRDLLIRGVGPGIPGEAIANRLAEPKIGIFDGVNLIGENLDWDVDQSAQAIIDANNTVGAFPLSPNSGDAAIIMTLNPGIYSARLENEQEGSGVGLLEIYDRDADSPDGVRLVNLSTRARIGNADESLIAGFVIPAGKAKKLLLRGVGPSLQGLTEEEKQADPQLHLVDAESGSIIDFNDNWGENTNAAEIAQTADDIGAATLLSGSKDAALLVTLGAGTYGVILSSVSGEAGIGLVEIYDAD